MVHTHWIWLGCFMAGVLAVALYGLTASGHFPVEARSERFKSGWGALVLWGTTRRHGIGGAEHAAQVLVASCPGISR